MLEESIFGEQPSFADLRLLRAARLAARDDDLHMIFDAVVAEAAAVRAAVVAAEAEARDWDIEPLLRLPLQPGRRVGLRSYRSPIHP